MHSDYPRPSAATSTLLPHQAAQLGDGGSGQELLGVLNNCPRNRQALFEPPLAQQTPNPVYPPQEIWNGEGHGGRPFPTELYKIASFGAAISWTPLG